MKAIIFLTLAAFGTSILQDLRPGADQQSGRLSNGEKRRRRHREAHFQGQNPWFANPQPKGQEPSAQFPSGGFETQQTQQTQQAGWQNQNQQGQWSDGNYQSQQNWFPSYDTQSQDQFPSQNQWQDQSLQNRVPDNSNYTILDEPLVVPVDAVVEGVNTTIRPRINLLIYGKIPKNMPLINLKLSVSKKFLENFDENGNPKPGFSINMDQIKAENIPDVMPRPKQPNFIQIGAPRMLYEDRSHQQHVSDSPAFQPAQPDLPAAQPYQQSAGTLNPVNDAGSFGYNRPVPPTQHQTASSYPDLHRQTAPQCKPVPNIGNPVFLVKKLLSSIDGQFRNPSTNTQLVFSQTVVDVHYLVFSSVATSHVAQYFGIAYNAKTDQVINFMTSPDISLIASQLGISQLDASRTIPCGDLGAAYRNPAQNS